MSGILRPGEVLPSERQLAELLDINRSTVNKAYWELKAEGFVHAQKGSGTVVSQQANQDNLSNSAYVPVMPWSTLLKPQVKDPQGDLIKLALESINETDVISFAGGFAGDDVLPLKMVETLMPSLLSKYETLLLHPTPLAGLPLLRKCICEMMLKRDVRTSINKCFITSGAQQAISYLTELFIAPGDMVFVASPSYIGAIEIFKAAGAKVVGIPTDQFGIDTDVLENYLIRYRPKLIYVNPNFQNPTGSYLPLDRRKKLLDLSYLYQIPVIEDDPYAEIHYTELPAPRLKAMDTFGYVIYIGTFSKQFFMGGRIGWVIAEPEIIDRLGDMKQTGDLHANTLHQFLMYEVISQGMMDQHIEMLKERIKIKRDLMIKTLNKHGIEGLSFNEPSGSFYLWTKLPSDIYSHGFFEMCKKLKVAIMPGDPFYPEATANQTYVRLNYSYPTEQEIIEGIERLVKAIKVTSSLPKNASIKRYNLLL